MRESKIESYDPGFRSPYYPWTQILGLLIAVWLIGEMGVLAIAASLGLSLLGLGWYFYYARPKVVRDCRNQAKSSRRIAMTSSCEMPAVRSNIQPKLASRCAASMESARWPERNFAADRATKPNARVDTKDGTSSFVVT